ncbi:hypothetical protein HNQ07_000413 [Deinococcus metalli]|uniref:HNH endonuclease n=1 Tax=Deinococcus metalli TaxID=1141878 RepID=A0A7W8KEB9_9DEIO|nr:hypothetical protein [Deinococcus metalli]MBB5374969.1 hypothetical protein [Deinococcus metalli]GHF32380.1 hypothetical protein GCM10017781_06290 [Deinococcus metalli]
MSLDLSRVCAYCGGTAEEREHVVARQFFPPDQRFRGDPVIVPACNKCNRAKQRVEDAAGVLIPFTGGGEAALKVAENRIPRTLAKNNKLANRLKGAALDHFQIGQNGKLEKRLAISLNKDNVEDLRQWFEFIAKGLYRYELDRNMPSEAELYLLWLSREQEVDWWRKWIAEKTGSQFIEKAAGEVKYGYAEGSGAIDTAWIISIYGATAVAITATLQPGLLKNTLDKIKWQ